GGSSDRISTDGSGICGAIGASSGRQRRPMAFTYFPYRISSAKPASPAPQSCPWMCLLTASTAPTLTSRSLKRGPRCKWHPYCSRAGRIRGPDLNRYDYLVCIAPVVGRGATTESPAHRNHLVVDVVPCSVASRADHANAVESKARPNPEADDVP